MKHIFTILLFSISFSAFSQYKLIKDEPKDCANLWLNFELLQMEASMDNLRAANLGLGINAHFQVKNRFGIEATARHAYVQIHLKGTYRFHLEAGGYFNFLQVIKPKTYSLAGLRPVASRMFSMGVRAGYAMNSESLLDKPLWYGSERFGGGDFKYQFSGIYAGLLFSGQHNFQMSTDRGVKGDNILKRFYLDVLIYPWQSLTDRASLLPYPGFKPGMFGGRFGYEKLYPEKKKNYGGANYVKFELGYRPVDGAYFSFAYGISWKEKMGKLNGFVQEREKE